MASILIRPQPISAISFDLDDTLYDNRPNILNAEQQLLTWLAEHYPKVAIWLRDDWLALKHALIKQTPSLAHDTSAVRLALLQAGLRRFGYSQTEAKQGAKAGLACFLEHRSNFLVSDEVIAILTQLAERFPLVGITNGNVDANRIGLGELLTFVLHPGNGVRMKPYGDLFFKAADRLSIENAQLVHVGDSYRADVQGARRAGCQAAWLNPAFGAVTSDIGDGLLPHLQLSSLDELLHLL
ncbi:HAD-IA family hydrolase [Shewanella sp. AS1]|uniref:HAD-IA family hydrolase n=1 Tax=Shewanella sp. AS1 TaxID=2907626 RepID=UPI001F296D8A|nr:HAD-IA family hydrolase [Shewanella sp. AS1]MCE9680464.1 HAD-IA family hydrolase [Shewanella sp. AS1]